MAKEDAANPLEMSDDDFMNADPIEFEEDPAESDDTSEDDNTDADDANDDDSSEGDDADDDSSADSDESDDDDSEEDNSTDDDDTSDDADTEDDSDESPKVEELTKPTPGTLSDEEYLAVGKQVMAEFKANGSKIKMKSADDIIQLMQMGANYHKKMSGLKPSLKTLKLLENNGLLDPEKLNYLIDLSQNKPEAITKLLKDSKMDPMEMDLESDTTYTPSQRTVSDTETVIDTVLDSIKDSDSYDRTLTVLGDDWDEASRVTIAEQPEIIRTVNAHMENGIFDQVMDTVSYERRLGKLAGMSDLEAYQRVGTYMHENKMFTATGQPQAQQRQQAPQNPNPGKGSEDPAAAQRQSRKKAASPSRQRKSGPDKGKNYNPLAMSDEEFSKIDTLSL